MNKPLHFFYSIMLLCFMHTNMNAQTWSAIFTPGSAAGTSTLGTTSLSDFSFYDDNTGVVSVGYVYYLTTNAGSAWTNTLSFSPYPNVKAVYYYGPQTIVAGADNGRVYKSTNGGTTFTQKGVPVDDVNAIDFKGNFGVLVDEDCKAAYSSDGGETWTSISYTVLCNNLSSMRNVNVVDANTTYISGTNSNFFKTTNGCSTWTTVTTGFNGNYTGLSFLDANNGYVTLHDNTLNTSSILKTTNGGATWTDLTANANAVAGVSGSTFGGVKMVSANTVYLGVQGKILVSTDGGTTFNLDFTNTSCTSCTFDDFKFGGNTLFAGVSNGGAHSKVYKKTSNVIGVKELTNTLNFSLSPNPTKDLVTVNGVNFLNEINIKIYSLDGKLVQDENINDPAVSVKNLCNGMYFIKVFDKTGKSGISKFIKE